jgi:site-specific DNA-methyltransferase (adenine-specific)
MIDSYYNDDLVTLYHGDCLKVMQNFEDNTFDMVFADPPYFLSNGGFTVHAGKRVSVQKGDWDKSKSAIDDFTFHLKWIQEVKRVLKPGGTIWISGTYHSIFQCGYALQLEDFKILNDISWFKPNASPNLACRNFTASHETLIWARKDAINGKHTFNYELMKNGDWHEQDKIKNPGTQMRSVWSLTTPKQSEKTMGRHPTQKPMELLKRIIIASTNEGDLILDPFNGSGTTTLVATQLKRNSVGIDMDENYLELAKLRINEFSQSKVNELF